MCYALILRLVGVILTVKLMETDAIALSEDIHGSTVAFNHESAQNYYITEIVSLTYCKVTVRCQ